MKKSSISVLSVLHLVLLVAAQTLPPIPSPTAPIPKRIDTHCHFIPPFYSELLSSRNITAGGGIPPPWNASEHLAVNALLGIETSVVSISTPGAKLSLDDPVEAGRLLARRLNEYGHNLTKEYPKRFLFWATLTLPDLDGAVSEAIYALDTLGASGVIILASVFGEIMGTPRYAPLYKVLNERKAVVFIHPGNAPCPQVDTSVNTQITANASLDYSNLLPFVVDFLLDTTRCALNLVYHNVTVDYPNIKFLFAHSGGFLPFAATRAISALSNSPGGGGPSEVPLYFEELTKQYVDVAISASQSALASTTVFLNDTQITFGSDYPYYPLPAVIQNTDQLQAFPLRHVARKKLDYGNAHHLFKKFLT